MATIIKNITEQYPAASQWYQQFPWFSLGHLVDAAQCRHTEVFGKAAQKAAIYFNDVHRIHWIINQQDFNTADILATFNPRQTTEFVQEDIPPSTSLEDSEEITDAPIFEQQQDAIVKDQLDIVVSEMMVPEMEAEPLELPLTETILVEQEEAMEPPATWQDETAGHSEMEKSDGETKAEPLPEPLADTVAVELTEDIELAEAWQDEDSYDPDDTDGPEETQSHEPELVSVMDIAEEKFESNTLSQSLAEVSRQFKEEPAEEELVISSEPFHTVDYFASQGIRLETDPRADDKFGQQLKSFTSWLRQMKRLPATKITEKEPDPLVESIASDSLQDGEVVTESMAEVLLMQGKQAQAIEVWQKLSLLHPEKSHYFATLIEKTKV